MLYLPIVPKELHWRDGCGMEFVGNTPHTHPRGSEISTLLYGAIEFGMIEENVNRNQLIIANITANTTIHIPTGKYNAHAGLTTAAIHNVC